MVKDTVPDNVISQHKFSNSHHGTSVIVREAVKNLEKHNGKNMAVFTVRDNDNLGSHHIYLAIATDSDPFANVENLKKSLRLNSSGTGIQGCGLSVSPIIAAGVPFFYGNSELIIYSNNFVVSSTFRPKDSEIGVYENLIEERSDLLGFMKKLIGSFKFPDGRDVNVLHLFKCGTNDFLTDKRTLANFREICSNRSVEIEWCIRHNQIASTEEDMYKIFTYDERNLNDHRHNRISKGVSTEQYEKMYSLTKIINGDMEVNFDYQCENGLKYEISALVDVSFVFYPGIKSKTNKSGFVTLRDVSGYARERKAGAKGGHDIEDSGNRIILSHDRLNFERPHGEPFFLVHESCPFHPSGYTSSHMGVSMQTRKGEKFDDIERFFLDCKREGGFGIDFDALSSSSDFYREPYLKSFLRVKTSKVVCVSEISGLKNSECTLIKAIGMTNCFYAKDKHLAQKLILSIFQTFRDSDLFPLFKKYYDIVFPKSDIYGLNQVPISRGVVERSRAKDRFSVMVSRAVYKSLKKGTKK